MCPAVSEVCVCTTERGKFAVSLWNCFNERTVPHDLEIIRVSVSSFLCKVAVFEGGSFGRLDRDGGSDQLRRALPPNASTACLREEQIPALLERIYITDDIYFAHRVDRLFHEPFSSLKKLEEIYIFCFSQVVADRVKAHCCTDGQSRKVSWNVQAERWIFWKKEGNKSEHMIILILLTVDSTDWTSSSSTSATNWARHSMDLTVLHFWTVAGFVLN